MSVQVTSENSIKTISIFLIKAFDPDPIGDFSKRHFRSFNPREDYPILWNLLRLLRTKSNLYKLSKSLYCWNNLSYLKRYPLEPDDSKFTPFDKRDTRIPRQWYYDYFKKAPIQVYMNLQFYLYQIEGNTKLMKELNRLLIAYGNHLIKQTSEYKALKWE